MDETTETIITTVVTGETTESETSPGERTKHALGVGVFIAIMTVILGALGVLLNSAASLTPSDLINLSFRFF